jgi:hypothetical protein
MNNRKIKLAAILVFACLLSAYTPLSNPERPALTQPILLQFEPVQASPGLGVELFTWSFWLAASLFLFLPPGWALLTLFWRPWNEHGWIEKICLATGTSLAVYPVILLFTHLVGLNLGALYAWLVPLISIGYILWHARTTGSIRKLVDSIKAISKPKSARFLPDLIFILVVILIFGTRFWNIRALVIPMWGDSYQHAMISQLMVDQGGLFSSWEPYVPYQTFTVHYGFSLFVALFSWVTNIPAAQATLIFGQILNGLAVILLYPWALRVSQNNRWAACAAVVIAGLYTQIPAIFVNWGRYAQLSGQAILPVAFVLLWGALDTQLAKTENSLASPRHLKSILSFSWSRLWTVGIVLAGMTLSYYRLPFFFATLVAAWLIAWGIPKLRLEISRWINLILALIITGGFAALLVIPWLYNLLNVKAVLVSAINPPLESLIASVLADYRLWLDLTDYISAFLLIASMIALVTSLIRKNWVVASLGLWVIFLGSIVAGRLINLPGTAAMQNFAIIIMLYIPASILIGWLVGEISLLVTGRWERTGNILVSVFLLILAVWGSINLLDIADPNTYAMVHPPDIQAMQWIKGNTPADARFLVEGYRIYNGTSAVGADAGWWISLLAKRQNTMPPQYALLNEVPVPADYSQKIVELIAFLENNSPGSIQGVKKLCHEDITHAYIGQGQGLVGFGARQLYTRDDFLNSPFWQVIYQNDRVYIFALDPTICIQLNSTIAQDQ